MNKVLSLDPTNRFSYAFKYTFTSFIVTVILSHLITLITPGEWIESEQYFYVLCFLPFATITGLLLIRYYFKLNFTWSNYNKMGIAISILLSIFLSTYFFIGFFYIEKIISLDQVLYWGLGSLLILFIIATITGIFLEKSSYKVKFKRLLGVILFVWAIYKLITSLTSKDDESTYGIDTDGDGVKDSFDTDGDGLIDTVYTDTDGDGVLDTVAMDTDGDGLVDTVASDLSGDGKIDTILKDIDGDGLADVRLKDFDGDGKIDSVS